MVSLPATARAKNCLAALVLVGLIGLPEAGVAQDTPEYFQQNCMNCHTIGGGALTGPDLKDVAKRQPDREWLIRFMMDPNAMIAGGDPYMKKILAASRGIPMPKIASLDRARAEKLLDLIEAESALEESQFKGSPISMEPFTDADRRHGREIFVGHQSLENGGAACIACHNIQGINALGGGRLGPDLTKIFEKYNTRVVLSTWLKTPATETMEPIFKAHPLKAEEIHALVAYFESTAAEPVADASVNRVAFLLFGLCGAAVILFAFDVIWKRRFHAVRRPLVESVSPRGES